MKRSGYNECNNTHNSPIEKRKKQKENIRTFAKQIHQLPVKSFGFFVKASLQMQGERSR